MKKLGIGVVGTGFIAEKISKSIEKSTTSALTAVSSRRLENAEAFVSGFSAAVAVEGVDALVARSDVDAVYIAVPTMAKEDIALIAINAGKHVLVEKPFWDAASVTRIAEAARDAGCIFMDATHFVHHPRTRDIQNASPERIGTPKSLHTAFYFPNADRSNIRFDPKQEPTGAIGDMAWYSMRAVVEFLDPKGAVSTIAAAAERDTETGAIIRVSGLIGFDSGETTTFDTGYTAGTIIMDLSLLGTTGMITLDDFVLDWANSIGFDNPECETGYVYRTDMAMRSDFEFVKTPSDLAQDVLMIDNFANLVASGDRESQAHYIKNACRTQQLLDAISLALPAV